MVVHPSPVAVQNVGWTWTATVAAVQTVIYTLFGAGGLYGIARGVALLWKMANERAKQDDDRDAGIRREMAELSDRQTKRIDKLEADLRDERKRCDEEMMAQRRLHIEEIATLKREHTDEMAVMKAEFEGYMRQVLQMQRSGPATNAPKTVARFSGFSTDIGAALEQAYKLPGVGE